MSHVYRGVPGEDGGLEWTRADKPNKTRCLAMLV